MPLRRFLTALVVCHFAEAADEPAARSVMESDPAVVAGVMTAELHPYAIALQRK